MARKKTGKHSKTPATASATARRSHVALGAATAVVGASLALGVTPAFAQTGVTPAAQPTAPAAPAPAKPQTPTVKQDNNKQDETNAHKQDAAAKKTERGGYPPRMPPLVTVVPTLLVTMATAVTA